MSCLMEGNKAADDKQSSSALRSHGSSSWQRTQHNLSGSHPDAQGHATPRGHDTGATRRPALTTNSGDLERGNMQSDGGQDPPTRSSHRTLGDRHDNSIGRWQLEAIHHSRRTTDLLPSQVLENGQPKIGCLPNGNVPMGERGRGCARWRGMGKLCEDMGDEL
eukprot:767923-Hanusia_phi.AAC.1